MTALVEESKLVPASDRETLLELRGLSVAYGDVRAVAKRILIRLEVRVFSDNLLADRAPKAPGASGFVEILQDRGIFRFAQVGSQ